MRRASNGWAHVGTPVITVNGLSVFGPVMSPIPRGGRRPGYRDGVLLIAGTDGVFELKRSGPGLIFN